MKPFIHLNSAMTVDGKIAGHNTSMKISGKKDLIRVHKLRKEYDAIMVGINTVIIDNPKLTIHKIASKKEENPIRIIIDSSARIPLNSKVLNNDAKTIVLVSKKASKENIAKLEEYATVIICGKDKVDLKKAMKVLYNYGIKSILLEGGSTINFAMLKENLVDTISICIGSKILGGTSSKTFVDGEGFDVDDPLSLKLKKIEEIDDDVVLYYDINY